MSESFNQVRPLKRPRSRTSGLHKAIRNGEKEFLEKLFEYDCAPDIDATDEFGLTPLHIALLCKYEDIATLLVRNGANLNVLSIEAELLPEIKRAIEESDMVTFHKEPYKKVCTKLTPLHIATITRSVKLVSEMIESGANVNLENDQGITPIHSAIHFKHVEMISVLFKNNARIGIKEEEEESNASDITGVEQLVKSAIECQDIELIKLFIDNCSTVNLGKVLDFAIEMESKSDFINQLIENGADVNFHNGTFNQIHNAMIDDQIDIVRFLIKNGANVNDPDLSDKEEKHTPLHKAVRWNQYEIAKLLIDNGADLDCQTGLGGGFWPVDHGGGDEMPSEVTPLQIAFSYGHIDIAEMLLQSGANVNLMNGDGYTALHYAMEGEGESLIQALIMNGADTEAQFIYDDDNWDWAQNIMEQLAPKPLEIALKMDNIDSMKAFCYATHSQ